MEKLLDDKKPLPRRQRQPGSTLVQQFCNVWAAQDGRGIHATGCHQPVMQGWTRN
jgi:hypothetical protein